MDWARGGCVGLGEKGGGKRGGLARGKVPLVRNLSSAPLFRTCEWLALEGRGRRGPGRVLHSRFIPDWRGNLSVSSRGMGTLSRRNDFNS